jgi:hypothetical protein
MWPPEQAWQKSEQQPAEQRRPQVNAGRQQQKNGRQRQGHGSRTVAEVNPPHRIPQHSTQNIGR